MKVQAPTKIAKSIAPSLPILEASKAARKKYLPKPDRDFNLVLAVDSYKLSHAFTYQKGIYGMAAYIEARTNGNDIIIPFGRQAALQKYLRKPITMANIDEAEKFAAAHGEPFARDVWEHILHKYNGFLPIQIRGVPEGTPVKSSNAITTVMCTDSYVAENIFWLCSYIEMLLLRAEWYPTTIATNDYKVKRVIKRFYEDTGADMNMLDFSLHDFGGRGVTCHEQAEIGGAAHTVSFKGSDTVEGVLYANHWYNEAMAAYSVPATEHSVQCSFGIATRTGKGTIEGELEYIRHVLSVFGKPGKIVSIVIDGFDVYRLTELLCTVLRDEIIACGAKVVFRPDSGDMMEVVPRILRMQEAAFGFTLNAKGYKKIKYVGVLQGDGVDALAIESLLGKIAAVGHWAADNIVFGSGGALLQKVNRDTYKFAQKASAVLVATEDGSGYEWVGCAKDPVTDKGKKSKEGVLTLVRSKMTGEYATARIDKGPLDSEWEDVMVDIYDTGEFFNMTNLSEVRARAAV